MCVIDGENIFRSNLITLEIPQKLIIIDKIVQYFGDLEGADSAMIFKKSGSKVLENLDSRIAVLAEAIKQPHSENILFSSHQLKSSFGTMGCPTIAALCGAIEKNVSSANKKDLDDLFLCIDLLSKDFKKELQELLNSL